MQIKSTSFVTNGPIPSEFTCRGEAGSPPLVFAGVPPETVSLAIWLHDPDAPSGDFNHWIAWNIASTVTSLPTGTLPTNAIEGTNDFGYAEYGGPCPPAGTGTHHYLFELFALNTELKLRPGTYVGDVLTALRPHVIAHAALTGTVSA